jgi:hypothetical protein
MTLTSDADPRLLLRFGRLVLVLVIALVMTLGPPSVRPAAADTPTGDHPDDAVTITQLPFEDVRDATTATDGSAEFSCSGNGHSLWYEFRPTASVRVVADTSGSEYDTTLSWYRNGRRLACDDDTHGLQAKLHMDLEAGVRYRLMVAACCGREAGTLRLSVRNADATPPARITLDETVRRPPGSAKVMVTGTARCAEPSALQMEVRLRRDRPGAKAETRGYAQLRCHGRTEWQVAVLPDRAFSTGAAVASVTAVACREGHPCRVAEQRDTVRLVR